MQRFSALVKGARDHLSIDVGDALRLTGVIGATEVEVTYGKIGGSVPRSVILEVERRLERHFAAIAPRDRAAG